jgi:hypothetical protein
MHYLGEVDSDKRECFLIRIHSLGLSAAVRFLGDYVSKLGGILFLKLFSSAATVRYLYRYQSFCLRVLLTPLIRSVIKHLHLLWPDDVMCSDKCGWGVDKVVLGVYHLEGRDHHRPRVLMRQGIFVEGGVRHAAEGVMLLMRCCRMRRVEDGIRVIQVVPMS